MKCQFCDKKCRLLKENDAEFSKYEMTWYCDKHSTAVFHHVEVERYVLRRDHGINGINREWTNTSIQWVNNKGQLMSAVFRRNSNKKSDGFVVYSVIKGIQKWDDRYNEIFSMKEYPKDFTPDNIAQKIATLAIFS
jgi:hypothetical protein